MDRGDGQAASDRRLLGGRAHPRDPRRGGEGYRELIVLDASAAAERLGGGPAGESVAKLIKGEEVIVPAIFDAEIFAATRRALLRGVVGRERAEAMLLWTARLVAERRTLTDLLSEAFVLRDRFGPYDVFYVALARRHGATLVTADRPLSRGAAGYVNVEYVEPS